MVASRHSGRRPQKTRNVAGKTQKLRRARSENDERQQSPGRSPSVDVPLWVKFAIPTAIIIAGLLLLQGLIVSQESLRQLEQQVNKRGSDLAILLSSGVPKEFWAMVYEDEDGKTIYKDKINQLNLPNKVLISFNENYHDQLKSKWEARIQKIIQAAQAASKENLPEIREVLILDVPASGSGKQLQRASAYNIASANEFTSERKLEGGVLMREGTNNEEVPIREYRIAIKGSDAKPLVNETEKLRHGTDYHAYLAVYLDAGVIQSVQSKTRYNVLIITLLGAIAAVIVIVLIANLLTRTIRQLHFDMAVVADGHFDHKSAIKTNDEIAALATMFNVMTDNLAHAQQQEADRKAIERELSIATEIQANLLPQRIPEIPGFDIHRYYLSAKEVGGDYYDFLVIDQQHLGIVVADVSGKGIPGSMVMTMVRSLLRLASVRNFSPADTFKKVNRILHRDIRRGMFVTAIYMVLDIVDRKLRVASAGHNPLVIYRAENGQVEFVRPRGIALGFDRGPMFDTNIREAEIELNPGDRIVAYTDGVNEAKNIDDDDFGDKRFHELVRKVAPESSENFVNRVVQALEDHQGEAEQSDDITLVTLGVLK